MEVTDLAGDGVCQFTVGEATYALPVDEFLYEVEQLEDEGSIASVVERLAKPEGCVLGKSTIVRENRAGQLFQRIVDHVSGPKDNGTVSRPGCGSTTPASTPTSSVPSAGPST